MNQYKKKRLKVLGKINHNNKYRYHRNPSLRKEEVLPMGGILHVVCFRESQILAIFFVISPNCRDCFCRF